ncbi:MAG: hypothetical protein NT027_09685 [Proteobacteria bacterium]|nr:hypothetical protein [Pseudomonadota bacterium]
MRIVFLLSFILVFAESCKSTKGQNQLKDSVSADYQDGDFREVSINEWQEISGGCFIVKDYGCACEEFKGKWRLASFVKCQSSSVKIVADSQDNVNDCVAAKVKESMCELKF